MSLSCGFDHEICVVDGDRTACALLSMSLTLEGYRVSTFVDGSSFLAAVRTRPPACVLLDLYLPGKSTLEILKDLDAGNYPAPIFVMSGHGDIPTAIAAVKAGAHDFIEKRADADEIIVRVGEAIGAWASRRRQDSNGGMPLSRSFPGYDRLTPREQEVLSQIASAASNKETARFLGISPRTVENHRVQIMQKLGARNTADLVRIVLNAGRGRHA
jgi:two-component system, LuxR family, response regulator FixJ